MIPIFPDMIIVLIVILSPLLYSWIGQGNPRDRLSGAGFEVNRTNGGEEVRERLGKKYSGPSSMVFNAALKRVKAGQAKRRRENHLKREEEDRKRNKTIEQMRFE
jgi:hypothetical protein